MTKTEIMTALNRLARADYAGDLDQAHQDLADRLAAELPNMPPICAAWPLWAMIAEAAPRNLERWRG